MIFKAYLLPIGMKYKSYGSNYFTFHFASTHFAVHIISIDFLLKKEKNHLLKISLFFFVYKKLQVLGPKKNFFRHANYIIVKV